MSKATEYLKHCKAAEQVCGLFLPEATRPLLWLDSSGTVRFNQGGIHMEHIMAVAHWILDTFGESAGREGG